MKSLTLNGIFVCSSPILCSAFAMISNNSSAFLINSRFSSSLEISRHVVTSENPRYTSTAAEAQLCAAAHRLDSTGLVKSLHVLGL